MDPTLQKHGAKHIYKVPEGLRELCSDISREVSLIFYCQMLKLSHMPSYNSKNFPFLKLYITHLAWITFPFILFHFIFILSTQQISIACQFLIFQFSINSMIKITGSSLATDQHSRLYRRIRGHSSDHAREYKKYSFLLLSLLFFSFF